MKVLSELNDKQLKDCLGKTFYWLWYDSGVIVNIKKCVLQNIGKHKSGKVMVEICEDRPYDRSVDIDHLYINYEDAEAQKNNLIDKLHQFSHLPYIDEETLVAHFEELKSIENRIDTALNDHSNYGGIDFSDVGAGGIQIRVHNSLIKNYIFGNQSTLKYDFSNIDDVVKSTVEDFLEKDNPQYIKKYLDFIAMGEKYGWD